jgi:hypothetical protein
MAYGYSFDDSFYNVQSTHKSEGAKMSADMMGGMYRAYPSYYAPGDTSQHAYPHTTVKGERDYGSQLQHPMYQMQAQIQMRTQWAAKVADANGECATRPWTLNL